MKINPNTSLLAAQNLRTNDATARGQQASANFFAELKKANPTTQTIKAASSQSTSTPPNTPTTPVQHLREAPLRQVDPTRPLPPGSLLNILV